MDSFNTCFGCYCYYFVCFYIWAKRISENIYSLAEKGDKSAKMVFSEMGKCLGVGMKNISNKIVLRLRFGLVGDAGAVGDEARQALLHGVERARGAPRLEGPRLGQGRAVDVLAQPFRGGGERRERAGHPAHGDERQRDDRAEEYEQG